jgi:exodeoxyribonuclease V alpha subunit
LEDPGGIRDTVRIGQDEQLIAGAQAHVASAAAGPLEKPPPVRPPVQVDAYETVLPATVQGIRRYLGSGLIKGIGPMMAERIVDHFAETTLHVIEKQPARLVEVPGLGPKRTAMITAAWEEQQAIKEVMVFLQGWGCRPRLGCGSTRPTGTTRSTWSGVSRTGWPPRCGYRVQDR